MEGENAAMRWRGVALLMPMLVAAAGGVPAALAQDSPKVTIAAQLRAQGYKCDTPQSAEQDMQASRPDEAVWVIVCEDARYRVRLDPDMAAKVERLDPDQTPGK
jgi:hypothetical protein